MPHSSSYGEAFGQRLHARATSFVSRALRKTTLAVTELRYDNPQHILSSPPIREDAFLVALHLLDFPVYEYWQDGRPAPVSTIKAGNTIVYDIKRNPVFHMNNVFHSVHFYFPRPALEAIADNAHAPHIDELRYQPGVSKDDHVMRGLTQSLLPAFAPIEILDANLDGEISPTLLAQECGLSVSHFARAFSKSTGMPPHRWLLQHRVRKARQAMKETDASLTDIALACGFADQSHFTRVFSKFAGVSPGTWRRQVRT